MKKKSSNFFLWASADRGSLLIFQLIALIYLSRILTPYEFGLIAIINIFIYISNVIIDSGMAGALIKEKKVADADFHTLFTFNLLISLFIYLFIYISAPYIADFYQISSLDLIIKIMSLMIIFNAIALTPTVILTKAHQFKAQTLITFSSQLLAVSVSVYLAKNNYGVWSLVSLQLLHSIASSVFLSVAAKYIPNLSFSLATFKKLFRFGWPLLISNILYLFNFNIYTSIIGKSFSPIASGHFFQAQKIQSTPIGILTAILDKVGFTILSQKSEQELVTLSHRIYRFIYLLVIPIFVFITYFSNNVFLLIFSDNWIQASNIFSILCLSLIPLTIKLLNRNTLKSLGKTKLILAMEFTNMIIAMVVLLFSINTSVYLVAYGILFTNITIMILSMYLVKNALNYKYYDQTMIIIQPILISLASLILSIYLGRLPELSTLEQSILTTVIYTVLTTSYIWIEARKHHQHA